MGPAREQESASKGQSQGGLSFQNQSVLSFQNQSGLVSEGREGMGMENVENDVFVTQQAEMEVCFVCICARV